jgi:diguanylate cyclase (GGDEF)-like protein
MEESLEHELKRSGRYHSPVSIAMFDIDHFKKVNDTFGHDIGDEVLKAVASIAKEQLREVDILSRWGGEEFMIISAETTLEQMHKLTERIRLAIENYQGIEGVQVTASFGIGEFRHDETQKQLLKRVDDALYLAKASGRNQLKIAS